MRILHISTGRGGGAHQAAKRLAEMQGTMGHEIIFVDSRSTKEIVKGQKKFKYFILRALAGVISKINTFFTKRGMYYLTPISVSRIDLQTVREINPQIVHIHNWFNILSTREIRNIASIFPVVITTHDERLFTGGCHYTFECVNYKIGCSKCPGSRFTHKLPEIGFKETRNIVKDENISVVTPSNWLFQKVEENIGSQIVHISKINNIQESNFYSEYESDLHSDLTVLTFIATDPTNPTKGLNLLLSALEDAKSRVSKRIQLNIIGKYIPTLEKSFEIQQHGVLNGYEIQKIFQRSHFTIVPSLQENSPSVAIESMLCGTPIIGSDVGGIPELLTDGENGFISKPNVLDLRETIIRAVSLSHKEIELMRVRTYTRAQREFNPQKILGQIDLHYATVNHVTRKCGDNEIN